MDTVSVCDAGTVCGRHWSSHLPFLPPSYLTQIEGVTLCTVSSDPWQRLTIPDLEDCTTGCGMCTIRLAPPPRCQRHLWRSGGGCLHSAITSSAGASGVNTLLCTTNGVCTKFPPHPDKLTWVWYRGRLPQNFGIKDTMTVFRPPNSASCPRPTNLYFIGVGSLVVLQDKPVGPPHPNTHELFRSNMHNLLRAVRSRKPAGGNLRILNLVFCVKTQAVSSG